MSEPFAPPVDVVVEPIRPARSTRVARLLAYAIDGGLASGVGFAVGLVAAFASVAVDLVVPGAADAAFPFVLASVALAMMGVTVAQWVAITDAGRSFGKWCVGLRIVAVRPDDDEPGFVQLIGLRSWAFALAAQITCGVSSLVDVLLIFRGDERCLHDHLAGTRVIEDSGASVDE